MKGTRHLQVAVLAVALAGCGSSDDPARLGAAGEPSPDELAAGAVLAERCADCHGAHGVSATRYIPHLAGQRRGYLVAAVREYLAGERDNPAMHAVLGGLDGQALEALAAYFAGQRPIGAGSGGAGPDAEAAFAAARWVHRCDRCHGELRWGDPERFPILDGQRPEYLASAMHAYQNRFLRRSSAMHAMTDPLGARDIGALADYYTARSGVARVGGAAID